MEHWTNPTKAALALMLLYLAFLADLAVQMPAGVVEQLMSEQGPFERMSVVLWLALAALALWRRPGSKATVTLMVFVGLAFAAREADLHKAYTVMSISKSRFYLSPLVPLHHKLIGGALVLGTVGALLYLLRVFYRYLFVEQGWLAACGQLLLLPIALLPITKLLDRSVSWLDRKLGYRVPEEIARAIGTFEEGMEMALPALLIAALVHYRPHAAAPPSQWTTDHPA